MPKTAVINRNAERKKEVIKHRERRRECKRGNTNPHLSQEERFEWGLKLQALPRDSSPVRYRNRCNVCGRGRGYTKLTGLCRLHMRLTMKGLIPGMHKSSW